MKTWLKGGLWGIIISVIYSIICLVLIFNDNIFQFDFSVIVAPFLLFGFTAIPILIILFFLIGAIIGKIKSKNKSK